MNIQTFKLCLEILNKFKMNKPLKYDGTPSQRKFKGFNFYIQSNEKLSKKNRETLLNNSQEYINEVSSSLNLTTDQYIEHGLVGELDPNLSDYELLEQWNPMFDQYGYLMSDLKYEWERDRNDGSSPTIQSLIDRIHELELRVKKLEMGSIKGSNKESSIDF